MKTILNWEEDIIKLTTKINSDFPELSKYMQETPVLENGTVNLKNLEDYYHSLEDIVSKYANTHKESGTLSKIEIDQFPGYPFYLDKEDIYKKSKEEKDVNPEDIAKYKTPNEKPNTMN
jgi:hypothetical protein